MNRWISTLAGGCLGLLLGFVLFGGDAEAPAPARAAKGSAAPPGSLAALPTDPAEGDTQQLREALAAQTDRAEGLARQVLQLQVALAEAEATAEAAWAEPEAGGREADDGRAAERDEVVAETGQGDAKERQPQPRRDGGWLDETALAAAGFGPGEIDALRAKFEEIELERLYLRDRATREGWVGKQRFRRKMERLDDRYDLLREEYGDRAYDWILYASGQSNRVETMLVMESSPAAEAGLQRGDVIVGYGGETIFTVGELQIATKTHGAPGDTVAIDVLRDGEELRFYLPVGPLGVQLRPVAAKPQTGR